MTALTYSDQRMMSKGLGAYQSQTVETASPAKLITMLYDGGLKAIAMATVYRPSILGFSSTDFVLITGVCFGIYGHHDQCRILRTGVTTRYRISKVIGTW